MGDDWREQLNGFFEERKETQQSPRESELALFIRQVVHPAFEQLREQLMRHGREVTLRESESSVAVRVHAQGAEELSYRIHGRRFPNGILPYAEIRFRERKGLKIIRVESMIRSGAPDYRIGDLTQEEVIEHFLHHYMRAVKPD